MVKKGAKIKLTTLANFYLVDFFLGLILWVASVLHGNKWLEVVDGLLVMFFSLWGFIAVNSRIQTELKKLKKHKKKRKA
ncbi:hypothetical protein ISS04_00690 [Candidatus Woesearchaeota archaeon]|nr:hypothetical protein [Candidatus Woesearchaeota archaeon]